MDVLRRNTDYALRAIINLARCYGKKCVSARMVAEEEAISYQLTCKLLQRLHNAGLVESSMGPKGGFQLSTEPAKISVRQVIEAVQGPLRLNRCLLGVQACPRQKSCPVRAKLTGLQKLINGYLDSITLDELLWSRDLKRHTPRKNSKGRQKTGARKIRQAC